MGQAVNRDEGANLTATIHPFFWHIHGRTGLWGGDLSGRLTKITGGLLRICHSFAGDLARFLFLANHADDSGSNFAKILSPKPVDKFVDNLKKNIMPY